MKRSLLLQITLCLCLFSIKAGAVWTAITNAPSTTQAYGPVSVTVTNVSGTTGGGCGGYYWTPGTNSSYTWAFSQTVNAIKIECDAINNGESIQFLINGSVVNLQPCQLDPNPFVNICSNGNCNIAGNQFINNTAQFVCGGVFTFYGYINTFEVLEVVGGSGTTYNIWFDDLDATSNSPICTPATLNLNATGIGGNFVVNGPYTWTGPGGFSSAVQSPSVPNIQPSQAGNYVVCVPDNCGSNVCDTAVVVVSSPPVITGSSSTNPTTCGGTDGTITIQGLAANANYNVTFDLNGIPQSVNVVSNASGTIIVTGLTQGTYTNIVVNAPPCASTSPIGPFTLTDPPLPAAPVINSNSPVCEQGTIVLSATSVPGGTFNWSGPAGFSSILQNPTIPNAQLTYEGNYSATVTVANCVSPATVIYVDITPLPPAPVTANIDYCQYDIAAPLTATGTALLWYTTQTGGTGSSVAPVPNTGTPAVTTYYVSQTVSSCEGPRAPLTVTVKPQPLAPMYTGPVHFCKDDPSSPLTANGQNIQWYDNNNNPLPGAPTPVTSVPGDFTWYVTQSINGCESPKTTIIVHVADIPPAPGTVDIRYCQFDTPLPLTAAGQALKWYNVQTGGTPLINTPIPNTDQPNTRTWYVSQTVDGCESPRAAITVETIFLPTSTFVPSRPLVCENDTLTFFYTGNATPTESYAWTWNNDSMVLVNGVTNTQGPIVIRFDSVGTFPLTLNVDNQGCNTTYVYNVRVVLVPDATISMPSEVCIHDSITVGMATYNQEFATYVWNFDGGVNVFNTVQDGPYKVQWNTTGIHIVDVTVGNTACESSFSDTVLVHGMPDARFSSAVPGSSICVGDSLRLMAYENNNLYTYTWGPETFFDQRNNFAPVVNAYIRDAQKVTLTISTPYGCTTSDSLFIDAQACCKVALPNAFTPNGDGNNDIFRPITVGNHGIKLFMIADRWGKKIFETLDEKQGWDGTYKGEDQDMGTYYYIMQYKCEGKIHELKGEVILVR